MTLRKIDKLTQDCGAFTRYYRDEVKRLFGISEGVPLGHWESRVRALLQANDLETVKRHAEKYLIWCKDQGAIPRWEGAVPSIENGIRKDQMKEHRQAEARAKRQKEQQQEFAMRKAEAVLLFGKPDTLEERRNCNDYIDSYGLLNPEQRAAAVREDALTDKPWKEKIGWRMEIIARYKSHKSEDENGKV